MAALTDLRNEVLNNLTNFGIMQGRFGWVRTDATSTDLTINIDSTSSVGEGVIEIDDEQLFVRSFDRVGNTATIAPDGRGWNGTTAAAHTMNTRVVVEPLFPKKFVDAAINATILRSYPTIWGVATTNLTANASTLTYELPASAVGVQSVSLDVPCSTGLWAPVRNYSFDGRANQFAYSSKKSLTINESVFPGRDIQVVYRRTPSALTANTTNFTDSGLQDSARYAITLGACAHLMRFADPTRLVSNTASADEFDSKRPYGTATKIANDLEVQFQRELANEAGRLRQLYPAQIHRKRF